MLYIEFFVWHDMKVCGQTERELHIRINQHRLDVYNENRECPTFEILNFRIHDFLNIQILEHVEDKSNRLARKNDFIVNFKNVFSLWIKYRD